MARPPHIPRDLISGETRHYTPSPDAAWIRQTGGVWGGRRRRVRVGVIESGLRQVRQRGGRRARGPAWEVGVMQTLDAHEKHMADLDVVVVAAAIGLVAARCLLGLPNRRRAFG